MSELGVLFPSTTCDYSGEYVIFVILPSITKKVIPAGDISK